jgi:hypothetical protein
MSPYYLPATAANCMEANRLRRPSLGARVVALRTRLDQQHATVSGMGYGITWRKTYSIIVFRNLHGHDWVFTAYPQTFTF